MNIHDHIFFVLSGHPFFAALSRRMKKVRTTSIPAAMGVTIQDGKYVLLWNPNFVETMSKPQMASTIIHEFLHIMLGHLDYRFALPNTEGLSREELVELKQKMREQNWGLDLAINQFPEVREGLVFSNVHPENIFLFVPSLRPEDVPRDQASEFYVKMIQEACEKARQNQPQQQQQNQQNQEDPDSFAGSFDECANPTKVARMFALKTIFKSNGAILGGKEYWLDVEPADFAPPSLHGIFVGNVDDFDKGDVSGYIQGQNDWTFSANLIKHDGNIFFKNNEVAKFHLMEIRDGGGGGGEGEGKKGEGGEEGESSGDGEISNTGTSSHDGWGENGDLSEADKKMAEEDFRKSVEEASNDAKKMGRGRGSASVEQLIEKILKKKTLDWRKQLEQLTRVSVRAFGYSTFRKLSRKLPWRYPGRSRRRTSRIAVFVDQSGSVCTDELLAYFVELERLSRYAHFSIIPFDDGVDEDNIQVVTPGKKIKAIRTRGGGTDFDSVTEWINARTNQFDACFIFTDLGAPKPKRCKLQRFWFSPTKVQEGKDNDWLCYPPSFGEKLVRITINENDD